MKAIVFVQPGDESVLHLLANISAQAQERSADAEIGRSIWGGTPLGQMPAWSVYWSIGGG